MRGDPPLQNLPKHEKYFPLYKPNDFFWGLGIEQETYIESAHILREVTFNDVWNNRKPERYSVRYYDSYKPTILKSAMQSYFRDCSAIQIPVLINSHAFSRTDVFNQPQTTYTRIPEPNPMYSGQSFHEYLMEHSEWFREQWEKSYHFDGDTFEFVTLNYYKSELSDILKELSQQRVEFTQELNKIKVPETSPLACLYPLRLATRNWPFATYTTNLKNASMFNNGTIHINITLPTQLNTTAKIADWKLFRQQHQILARLIQWVEPILIARFGTGDPFSKGMPGYFSGASQRLAVSRYIGIGTYDTKTMPVGKILQVQKNDLRIQPLWYDDFYTGTGYEALETVGLDINFNKHGNHGLEIRFLDGMYGDDLEEAAEFIIWLADWTLATMKLPLEPQSFECWQTLATGSLQYGKTYMIKNEFINELSKVLPITCVTEIRNIQQLYQALRHGLQKNFGHNGPAGKYFFGTEKAAIAAATAAATKVNEVIEPEIVKTPTIQSVPIVMPKKKRFWLC